MDTPLHSMDKPIEKKKGLQKKHFIYAGIAIAFGLSDIYGFLQQPHINIQS